MQPTVQELLSSAQEIKQEILADRRTIHQNPEVGTHLPATKAYVMKRLIELGYEPQELCESGIVATITGKRHRTLYASPCRYGCFAHTGTDRLAFSIRKRLYARLRTRYAHSDAVGRSQAASQLSKADKWHCQAGLSAG